LSTTTSEAVLEAAAAVEAAAFEAFSRLFPAEAPPSLLYHYETWPRCEDAMVSNQTQLVIWKERKK
jgi:hypothetical protein